MARKDHQDNPVKSFREAWLFDLIKWVVIYKVGGWAYHSYAQVIRRMINMTYRDYNLSFAEVAKGVTRTNYASVVRSIVGVMFNVEQGDPIIDAALLALQHPDISSMWDVLHLGWYDQDCAFFTPSGGVDRKFMATFYRRWQFTQVPKVSGLKGLMLMVKDPARFAQSLSVDQPDLKKAVVSSFAKFFSKYIQLGADKYQTVHFRDGNLIRTDNVVSVDTEILKRSWFPEPLSPLIEEKREVQLDFESKEERPTETVGRDKPTYTLKEAPTLSAVRPRSVRAVTEAKASAEMPALVIRMEKQFSDPELKGKPSKVDVVARSVPADLYSLGLTAEELLEKPEGVLSSYLSGFIASGLGVPKPMVEAIPLVGPFWVSLRMFTDQSGKKMILSPLFKVKKVGKGLATQWQILETVT